MKMTAAIFDVGGVLVETDYKRCISIGTPAELKAIHDTEGRTYFDLGNVTEAEFRAHASQVLGRTLKPAAFRKWWNAMLIGPIVGTVEWAERLRRNGVSVGVLSNTNCIHFPAFQALVPFLRGPHVYASHLLRHRKPDKKAFQMVLDSMGLDPKATVFIDDKQRNIDAAEALGMEGILAESPEYVSDMLSAKFGDMT